MGLWIGLQICQHFHNELFQVSHRHKLMQSLELILLIQLFSIHLNGAIYICDSLLHYKWLQQHLIKREGNFVDFEKTVCCPRGWCGRESSKIEECPRVRSLEYIQGQNVGGCLGRMMSISSMFYWHYTPLGFSRIQFWMNWLAIQTWAQEKKHSEFCFPSRKKGARIWYEQC